MEAPRIPSFFKSRGPKQFNYRPWFYDEEKEKRERRNRILKSGMDLSSDEGRIEFRSKLHEKWRDSHSGSRQRSKSNFRLILIIGLLFWVAYILLK